MKELHSFYSDLYKKSVNENSDILTDSFMRDLHLLILTSDQTERCDEKLSIGKCFNTLKTFQKNNLDHTYLFKVLNAFKFGPSFIRWIRVLYSNISSCIINNGCTSNYFAVGRGARQGDPLSPLLFILGLEILACSIRKNDNSEVKLTLFAADFTCFLSNRSSYDCLRDCLSKFSECSGLKVNEEKTELFKLGTRNLEYERS